MEYEPDVKRHYVKYSNEYVELTKIYISVHLTKRNISIDKKKLQVLTFTQACCRKLNKSVEGTLYMMFKIVPYKRKYF